MKVQQNKNESKFLITRIIYIILGFITLVIGFVGILLPIIPTVPLFLLTTFFFAKGSKKFHNWFMSTKLYKKYLSNFVEHRSMNIIREIILLCSVSLMLIIVTLVTNKLIVSIIMPIVILILYSFFFFYVRSVSNNKNKDLLKNYCKLDDVSKSVVRG
ncbi:TPA: DUF454 domain-containing protein [bacterium]|nr:DUF454 domain-containing protein [bacterium]